MKKLFFGVLSLFLFTGLVNAQEGEKALKKAKKELSSYTKSMDDAEKLANGMALLEKAFQAEEVKSDPEAYITKGEIFNDLAEEEVKQKLLNPAYQLTVPDASLKAYNAFKMALNMTDDKGDRKDALEGIEEAENHLNNSGIVFWDAQDYANAFVFYNAAVDAYDVLKANDRDSRLDDETIKNDHYFITAAAGYYGGKAMEAKPVFIRLYDMGTDKPLVYEALYTISAQEGSEDADRYLMEGREKFPDDTGLLFAEINYYLKAGKLEQLIDKLEQAKEKEPDNNSIVVTLGNVYDQLSQQAREKGDTAQASVYFDKAFQYYGEALENDPSNFDAAYSQGALYYNKAAALTEEINKYAEDFTPEGTKKYDAAKAKMNKLFDQALPYFENAEKINPNDMNVLIAMREIYARKNMLDKAAEYKARLDALGQ